MNRLLTQLPGEDFARLLPHLEPILLQAGEQICELGVKSEFGYFPETAVISQLFFLEDGSSMETATIGNEGIVGLSAIFGSGIMPYWAKVTVSGAAVRVSMSVLRNEFSRGKSLQKLLLGYATFCLIQLSQRVVCNGRHVLEERLCTWFLLVLDRANDGPLSLTHEEIASHLGARRAGITSICNTLRDNRIIEYRRGIIKILDRPRLESIACECYSALKTRLHSSVAT